MTALLNWLKTTPPTWAQNVIQNWENLYKRQGEVDMLSFVTREIFESHASLDMRTVVGQRDHYAGQTWLEAALNPQYREGKMREVFRLYQENPDYYFTGDIQNGISVSSLNGGSWYSDGGGNHRTVLAKFACENIFQQTGKYPTVIGVQKHHYFVALDAWELFMQMRQFEDKSIFVSIERQPSVSHTSIGLNVFNYDLKFHVTDYRFCRNGRAQWLDTPEFIQFSQHVLKTNASASRSDKLKHHWRELLGDSESLIYQK